MATKSIYKDVRIKDPALCKKFVRALENAERNSVKNVVLTRQHENIAGPSIKKLFGVE